ncbi:hypothetical protein Hte_001570 [Hypoxylon texense]
MFGLKSALAIALLAATAVWSDVSPDETCGEENGYTCPGEIKCCSVNGFCGSTDEYCLTTAGCQSEFSNSTSACTEPVDGVSISPDGTCGSEGAGEYGYRCPTEDGNSCCSIAGYCGNTTAHCSTADGCQSAYGECE